MCVSYCGLNKVTKSFEYLIPSCDEDITLILVGSNTIYFITVDANQGYHEISVYVLQQGKLAFFAPNNRKCVFKVIPFGPMNTPAFYTCMMQNFQAEWDLIFVLTIRNTIEIGREPVRFMDTNYIDVGNRKNYYGSEGIITVSSYNLPILNSSSFI